MHIKLSTDARVAAAYNKLVELTFDAPLRQLIMVLYGKAGAGKTTLAATASEFWPGLATKRPAKPTTLKDMFWLELDNNATLGFSERGISVPKFSLQNFMADPKLYEAAGFKQTPTLEQALMTGCRLAAVAASKGARWVVVDTVSALDKLAYEDAVSHNTNTLRAFGELQSTHISLHLTLVKLGLHVIYLAHSRYIGEPPQTSTESNKLRASRDTLVAVGAPDVTIATQGSGGSIYINEASMLWYLDAKEVKQGEFKRVLYTQPTKKVDAKNRLALSLDVEESPNLRTLFKKCNLQL